MEPCSIVGQMECSERGRRQVFLSKPKCQLLSLLQQTTGASTHKNSKIAGKIRSKHDPYRFANVPMVLHSASTSGSYSGTCQPPVTSPYNSLCQAHRLYLTLPYLGCPKLLPLSCHYRYAPQLQFLVRYPSGNLVILTQVAIEQLQQELTSSRSEEQAIRDEANRVGGRMRQLGRGNLDATRTMCGDSAALSLTANCHKMYELISQHAII